MKLYLLSRPEFKKNMTKNKGTCFVCEQIITKESLEINQEVFLPVCRSCRGTEAEKKKAEEYLDSLADGLVCGCI